jgi:S-formylglutathione hydrolase FrmB
VRGLAGSPPKSNAVSRRRPPIFGGRRPRRPASRRVVGLAVVAAALIAGAIALRSALTVDKHGATVRHVTIASRYVHRSLRATLVQPAHAAGRPRPLLVFLHGRGDDGEDSNLHEELFAALARLGPRAPAIVFPDGGEHSYWHDRAGGAWGRYVMDEVIPMALRELHADPRRVAIGGISMGGFGALDLARLHPGRFCAAGAHSPALWQTAGETAAGAFDDAGDFARNDLIHLARTSPRAFAGQPLWLDAGDRDPFDAGDRALVATLHGGGVRIEVHRWPGEHDGKYWRSHWDRYLHFYARALERCGQAG